MSLKQKLEEIIKMNKNAYYETSADMCEGLSGTRTEEHMFFMNCRISGMCVFLVFIFGW